MSSVLKKILLIVGIITLVLFIVVIGAAWILGAFSSVEITEEIRGPYNFVCLEHIGAYHLVVAKIEKVKEYLDSRHILYIHSAGLYFDDPAKVAEDKLRSFVGYLVPDSLMVEKPFQLKVIKKRNVILASIEAHAMIAPFKVYPAFHEWMESYGDNLKSFGAPLEIYKMNDHIEVEFPVQ